MTTFEEVKNSVQTYLVNPQNDPGHMLRASLISAIIAVLIAISPAFAIQTHPTEMAETGSIKITVTDKLTGQILYNAKASVFSVKDGKEYFIGSEDTLDGVAGFYGLPVGDYIAFASASGYVTGKSEFKITAYNEVGSYLTIALEKNPDRRDYVGKKGGYDFSFTFWLLEKSKIQGKVVFEYTFSICSSKEFKGGGVGICTAVPPQKIEGVVYGKKWVIESNNFKAFLNPDKGRIWMLKYGWLDVKVPSEPKVK